MKGERETQTICYSTVTSAQIARPGLFGDYEYSDAFEPRALPPQIIESLKGCIYIGG